MMTIDTRDQFMREHCRSGQAAMCGVTVCAVAFSPLYTGGEPCSVNIDASPAEDFFCWSTPADPEMLPWRCSKPDALRELANVLRPAGEHERWWCEPTTGGYGVRMMQLGFSIGVAGEKHRQRERKAMASVCASLCSFGLHARVDPDFGWIVLVDQARPYRV